MDGQTRAERAEAFMDEVDIAFASNPEWVAEVFETVADTSSSSPQFFQAPDCVIAAIAAKAIRAALAKLEWKPIETVPKDGDTVAVGRWVEYEDGSFVWVWWDAILDGESLGYDGIEGYPPTHWMSLPAPPEKEA